MSVMFEVYYREPVDAIREKRISQEVTPFGGQLTFHEEPKTGDILRIICLTYEFLDLKKAEQAADRLREMGEHVENIVEDYGSDPPRPIR
jgi:hypothetical protein